MRNREKWIVSGGLCMLLFTAPASAQIIGGMLDPAIDVEGEPFSYFWHPSDIIGALYAPMASEVTPEGYIYTGFGELMFLVGNPPVPINQRIKTLYKGYLPVVQYEFQKHAVRYRFTLFGADLGGKLEGLPVNFVKVELRNEAHERRTAFLSSAYRYAAPINQLGGLPDYRFNQRFDRIPGEYAEGLTEEVPGARDARTTRRLVFNPDWKHDFSSDALVRDGRILYFFPPTPAPHQVSLALGDTGLQAVRYFTGEVRSNPDPRHTLDPHTPMGVATYRIRLGPGESRNVIFKMPIVPLPEGSREASQVRGAGYEEHFQKTVSFWEDLVAKNAPIRFPEEKAQNFLLANTVFDLLAIDKVGDDYIPNVNKFQYHKFWGSSDTAHMLIGLDYLGLQDIAGKGFLYSLTAQAPDGAFVIPPQTSEEYNNDYPLYETFGFALWGWGRHYRLTRDESFLQQIYPGVQRGMQWLQKMIENDPLGLLPPISIGDDAMLANVRYTGQDIWALIGLRNAVSLAETMGHAEDIRKFRTVQDGLRAAFKKLLAVQTAKSGGYIPSSLERTLEGNNWDNMLLLYPEPLFEPFDPRVTATIQQSRRTYAEGILDYGRERALAKEDWPVELEEIAANANRADGYIFDPNPRLHYWQAQNNAQSHLVRGRAEDQRLAVKDLYALLLHTTSTHAPQEWGTYPWSTRDHSGHNLIPDGPASGKTIELLRNMLVREYQNDLYFFSALSPTWFRSGSKIELINEPTEFGPVSVELKVNSSLSYWGWQVRMSNQFWQAPRQVVIRIPWFYELQRAEADGEEVEAVEGELRLPPTTREVKASGRVKPNTPEMSFERTVEDYKKEYRERFQEFLRTGTISGQRGR